MSMKVSRRLTVPAAIISAVALLLSILFALSDRERLDLDRSVLQEAGDWVELPHGAVSYRWSGPENGPVVVLVNPFSVPMYVWERNADVLARDGYRVLRYDLYGRGLSNRPRVRYDVSFFVGQLESLIRALAVPTPVRLAGVSMGAEIAAAYTARHPELVARVCLMDPRAVDITWKTTFPMGVPGLGEYLMTVAVIPFVLSSPASDFFRPESVPDWGEKYREQTRYRGFRRALLSTMRSFDKNYMETYTRVGELGTPVLLIWGEKDKTVPISYAPRIQSAIPQAELHVIPNAGHLAIYERADLVNPILSAFLAR